MRKIIVYCQHVLGVGHFFRTLEIVKAMESFEVILVTGGETVDVPLPDHVKHVALPGLMMDKEFKGLYSIDPDHSVEKVKLRRQEQLLNLVKTENPDFFFIELYPFGRRAFRFELIPVLTYLTENRSLKCKVICSLRDILVEKEDKKKYETRVIDALNRYFNAVLIHSDPELIRLDDSFSRLDKINIPLFYTGFITPLPDRGNRKNIREQAGVTEGNYLVVASAGGGNVGAELLKAVIRACEAVDVKEKIMLHIYTGPYMAGEETDYLYSMAGPKIKVARFTNDFVTLLHASDLSISMAGYNTCMNIVAAGVRSLVLPFDQNREQRQRAEQLSKFFPMTVLTPDDLAMETLGKLMDQHLGSGKPQKNALNINGAYNSVEWVKEQIVS